MIDCLTDVSVRCAASCVPVLIQQNVDGSDAFNRSWAEFKVGFNDTSGNYWLGNDLLSQLTQNDGYRLRFDLQLLTNLSWYWAEYSSFVVSSERQNYRLLVSGYSGNIGDPFRYNNDTMFTTYDRDNDRHDNNCAVTVGGGFWYSSCGYVHVNGVGDGFQWLQPNALWHSLQSSRMWLTC